MAYVKTVWIEGIAPGISAARLNNLETQYDEVKGSFGAETFIASDKLRSSNDTERTTESTSYVKLKEILLNGNISACRIKFDLKVGNIYNVCYGRVYKNGVAIGTERNTSSNSYITFSEDFSPLISGDLLQIYIKLVYGGYSPLTVYVANFRIYYNRYFPKILDLNPETPFELETVSTTNQDP